MSEKRQPLLPVLQEFLAHDSEPTASKSRRTQRNPRAGTSIRTPTGEASATTSATARNRRQEPSLSPETQTDVDSKPGGSARRHYIAEYRWLRRTLKHRTVLYITKALEESRMS